MLHRFDPAYRAAYDAAIREHEVADRSADRAVAGRAFARRMVAGYRWCYTPAEIPRQIASELRYARATLRHEHVTDWWRGYAEELAALQVAS